MNEGKSVFARPSEMIGCFRVRIICNMRKFLVIMIIFAALIAGVQFYAWDDINQALDRVSDELPQIRERVAIELEDAATELQNVVQEIKTPPLRQSDTHSCSSLTVVGTIQWTNSQRALQGLAALTENAQLRAAAETKVSDMFAEQYFEHVNPEGRDVSDLVDQAGYVYVLVGENLALGNFEGDKGLVQAWMDSPGHRANILNNGYTEIGVAVREGTFDGRKTWLAVQTFGKQRAACPKIDASLKASIEANKAAIQELEADMQAKKQELDEANPKQGSAYRAKIEEYNALVEEYNDLVEKTQQLVATYNVQVQKYNACAQK